MYKHVQIAPKFLIITILHAILKLASDRTRTPWYTPRLLRSAIYPTPELSYYTKYIYRVYQKKRNT